MAKKFAKSGTNMGGICRIEIADIVDVQSDPVSIGDIVVPPQLKAGKTWDDIYFTPESAHMVEETDGQVYNMVLRWRIPKVGRASLAAIIAMHPRRYLAKITDRNGTVSYAGTRAEPCSVRLDQRDWGKNFPDSNHHNIVLRLARAEPVTSV